VPQANKLAGWASPKERDYRSASATEEAVAQWFQHPRGKDLEKEVTHLTSGVSPDGTGAVMGSTEGYLLNPHFSRWLQGYPAEWQACADMATRSIRR
jgi:hypothetical protein